MAEESNTPDTQEERAAPVITQEPEVPEPAAAAATTTRKLHDPDSPEHTAYVMRWCREYTQKEKEAELERKAKGHWNFGELMSMAMNDWAKKLKEEDEHYEKLWEEKEAKRMRDSVE